MKLAIISTYPPQKDGIGIYTKNLVDSLLKRKKDVKVITFKSDDSKHNKHVIRLISKNNPLSYIRAANFIRKKKIDKILIEYEYLHYNVLFFPLLLLSLRCYGKKINLVMHTVAYYKDFFRSAIFKIIHLSLFLFINKIFLHTKNAKLKLQEIMMIKRPIEVLPMPIAKREVKSAEFNKKQPTLLNFGFITHDKGTDILCDSAKYLKDFEIIIAGIVNPLSMKKQQLFLKRIKEYTKSSKNIKLINRFVSEKEKEELFRKADFIVLPYRFIEQSATLTDAWSFGKIPVCSDIKAFREEIGSNKYGVLFKNGDPDDLRIKILDISKNKQKQRKILKNIKNLVKERSFDRIAERFFTDHKHLF